MDNATQPQLVLNATLRDRVVEKYLSDEEWYGRRAHGAVAAKSAETVATGGPLDDTRTVPV